MEWTRQYSGEKGYDQRGKRLKNKETEISIEHLSKQNKRILELEELLRKEKLKVSLSNTMIDIAEEEFGINIRKKYVCETPTEEPNSPKNQDRKKERSKNHGSMWNVWQNKTSLLQEN